MKRINVFFVAALAVSVSAIMVSAQGAPAGQAQGGGPGRQGPAVRDPANTTNERDHVQIDQFIGDAAKAPVHLSHGGLMTRAMLTHGNPNVPGPAGAVLEYRTQIAKATLLPKSTTPLMSINNQFLFYVVSGEGRLDDGKTSWDLHNGITMLIPPDVQRRFINTSNDPLDMVMVEWPANAIARKDILVRDVTLLPYCEENAHWNNFSKCPFTAADGMTGRVLLVMLLPMTMAAPHPHVVGFEETWTKITPGSVPTLLGSELRDLPQFSAFLAPPNNITWHAQINTSKTQTEMWLYVAGGNVTTPPPPQTGGGGGRGGGPGAGNPNLSRDQAVVDRATVKGKPLQ